MRKKFLLGTTKDNEVVFCEMELRDRNGKIEFSASFNTVYPFEYDDKYLKERLKDNLDCYDKDYLYCLCDRYNCSSSQLVKHMYYDSMVEEIIDISLYPNSIRVNGNDWYFESSACGQHDTREEMEFYVNKNLYNRIIELWDEYHLKEMPQTIIDEVNTIIEELEKVDEEEWIKNFIEENLI